MRIRLGLVVAFLFVMAAPQAASAANGPLLSLTPERVGHDRAVLAGAQWRVRVVLQPYVADQVATVRFYRHDRKIAAVQVALQPSPTGRSSFALVPFQAKGDGRIVIRATHRATTQLGTLKAKRVRVSVVPLHASPGARGPVVRLLQRELAARGYVVGQRGLYDDRTARAVLAFRKVTGMARTTLASPDVFRRLAKGGGVFRVRFPSHGKHVEADVSRQVLALIQGGRAVRIYPMSSGKPSTSTVLGSFRVYTKSPGTNAKGMFFSSYFLRGYAIHGYPSVPDYAASHGCLRIPIPDAISVYNWLRIGDIVDVYA